VRIHFAQLAVQYYVAGRAAAINHLIPVLGNLLHHAVEMTLKAALAGSHSMAQLRGLGHNLPNLWSAFATAHPSVPAVKFDPVVSELHRFEELRYPDSVMAKGAMMQLALFREHVGVSSSGSTSVPSYLLVLEDVDELESCIFAAMDVNPKFFFGPLSPRAREHLFIHNRHASNWN
jgi:hypothetical protein